MPAGIVQESALDETSANWIPDEVALFVALFSGCGRLPTRRARPRAPALSLAGVGMYGMYGSMVSVALRVELTCRVSNALTCRVSNALTCRVSNALT